MGGGEAAVALVDLDTGVAITLPYAPASLVLADGATYRPDGNVERPSLAYERGRPATLSTRLVVDATLEPVDLDARYLTPIRRLLDRTVDPSGDGRALRPPRVALQWGRTAFVGVVTELTITATLFARDGAPVRAEIDLVLTEDAPADGAVGDAAAAEAMAQELDAWFAGPGR